MKNTVYLLVFVLALALTYASAQTGSSGTGQTPPSQSQPPSAKDPTTPSTTGTLGSNPPTTTPDTQTNPGVNNAATSGSDLQGQIQNALKNEPTLAGDNVNVTVSDSEIDLAGTVASGKEKLTAKRIVQSYAGNRKVKEHLTVGSGQDNVSNPTHNNENPISNAGNNTKPTGNRPPR